MEEGYAKSYVKMLIKDILNFRKELRGSRVFILTKEFKVSRVRVVGVINRVYEYKNRVELVIDDGTGEIIVKVWSDKLNDIKDIEKDQVVEVFGSLRVYKDTIYINLDRVVKVAPDYLKLRRLEAELIKSVLFKQYE